VESGVSIEAFPAINLHPECKPVDEQAYHDIVHRSSFGKANGLAHEALDARTQRQMRAFELLGMAFANRVLSRLSVALISTPAIGVKTANAERCE